VEGTIKQLKNFSVQVLYSLAIILEKLGYLTNALSMLQRAITSAPNNQKLYLLASRLYLKKGQLDKAMMCWEKAVGQENLGVFLYWLNSLRKKSYTEQRTYPDWWLQQRQITESYGVQSSYAKNSGF